MTLRIKTAIFIIVTLLILIVSLAVAAQYIVLNSFAHLEEQDTYSNVERVRNAVAAELATLATLAQDYAAWDDTYAFIQDRNPEFIHANFTEETLANLQVNLIVLIDTDGGIAFASTFDLEASEEISVPDDLETHLRLGDPLLNSPDDSTGVAGILRLSQGPVLVASSPILTSLREGPQRGMLLFGRFLNEAKIQQFAEAVQVSLTAYPVDAAGLPEDFATASSLLSAQVSMLVRPLNNDLIAGYTRFDDVYASSAVILRVDKPRDIYAQGQASYSYLIVSLVVTGVVVGIISLFLRERVLFSRMLNLSHSILQMRNSADLSLRVPVNGNDEIADLARVINLRLDALQQAQDDLYHLNHELEARAEQLERAKNRTDVILSSTSDALAVTHPDGTIRQTNSAFNSLLGYQIDEAFGVSLTTLVDYDDTLASALDTVARGNQSKRAQVIARRKDGTTFHADMMLAPIRGEQREITGIVCSLRDISERMRYEEELSRALAKEKELNKFKARFTSMMSHEFRTPLSVIRSGSDLLRHFGDRMTDERRMEHLNDIVEQVEQLVSLLDDILAISRADSVGLDFHATPIDLEERCKSIARRIQQNAAETHRIVYSGIGAPLMTMADGKLIGQVISNLLTNAVKYSPAGGAVYLDLIRTDEQAEIRVRDEGIGIPESDLEHLFERFHRASNVGEIAGTGLGLVVIKHAVGLHGGTIGVESRVGEGTTFTVTLPIRASIAAEAS